MNKLCNNIKNRKVANDKIYTPLPIAKRMIELCNIQPNDTVLDCSKGAGVFYDNLPECKKDWCEVDTDIVGNDIKDYFDYNTNVDLVIGNPPYSLWDKWIEHTMKITNKFCFIFGVLNLTQPRVRDILNNGFGITKIEICSIDYWFGHHFIVIFEKNKPSLMSVYDKRVYCDICNKRCKRGKKGYSFNKCYNDIGN